MLARDYLDMALAKLKAHAITMPRVVAESVLAHVCSISRSDIEFYDELSKDEILRADNLIEDIVLGTPFEYVIGKVDFYGVSLELSRKCLIPRAETELMLDFAVKACKKRGLEKGAMLDLCAGSGAIGLGFKKAMPSFDVILSDIDSSCTSLILHNAQRNQLEVTVKEGDFLAPMQEIKFDVILCNPPYISEEEFEDLAPSVKDFEPKKALVAPECGLYFYKKLAKELPLFAKKGALIFLEIGKDQKVAVSELFQDTSIRLISCQKDLSSHDRFLFLEA